MRAAREAKRRSRRRFHFPGRSPLAANETWPVAQRPRLTRLDASSTRREESPHWPAACSMLHTTSASALALSTASAAFCAPVCLLPPASHPLRPHTCPSCSHRRPPFHRRRRRRRLAGTAPSCARVQRSGCACRAHGGSWDPVLEPSTASGALQSS